MDLLSFWIGKKYGSSSKEEQLKLRKKFGLVLAGILLLVLFFLKEYTGMIVVGVIVGMVLVFGDRKK